MKSATYTVRETDPFEKPAPFKLTAREPSPHVTRTRLMWHEMPERVIPLFPAAPKTAGEIKAYMQHVEDVYVTDAYHSLLREDRRQPRWTRLPSGMPLRLDEGAQRTDGRECLRGNLVIGH